MINKLDKIKEEFQGKILRVEERSPRRIYLEVKPEDIVRFCAYLYKDLQCRFCTATATDTPAAIEILYHFSDDPTGQVISLRTLLTDKAHLEIDSISPLMRGAQWIEREMWELLGITFKGHPNLTHLLLIDEWPEGEYPLRHKK